MANSHGEIFNSLRTDVLNSLVDSRHSIDDSFGALPEEKIRIHFRNLLEHMQKYLASPSPAQLHESVTKWTAMLLGLGLAPRSVLRAVVTLGDLVVSASKANLPPGPDTNLFVRAVVRLNFNSAREVVAIFHDELKSQRTLLSKGKHASN